MLPTARSIIVSIVVCYCYFFTVVIYYHFTDKPVNNSNDNLHFVKICGDWIDSAKDIEFDGSKLCAKLKSTHVFVDRDTQTKHNHYKFKCVDISRDVCYDNIDGNFVFAGFKGVKQFENFTSHTYFEPINGLLSKVTNVTYFHNGNICGIFELTTPKIFSCDDYRFYIYKKEEKCDKFNKGDYILDFSDKFITVNKNKFDRLRFAK